MRSPLLSTVMCLFTATVMSACCADGTFGIRRGATFTHDQNDALPASAADGRTRYTPSFDQVVQDWVTRCNNDPLQPQIAGLDVQYRYRKVGRAMKPTERIFQRIVLRETRQDRERVPPYRQCFIVGGRTQVIWEVWAPGTEAIDVIAHFTCNEGYDLRSVVTASVAIIDLEDLDQATINLIPNIGAGENVAIIRDRQDLNLQATVAQRLDVDLEELDEEIEDCTAITWGHTYHYDGCDATPAYVHNLDVWWEDDRGRGTRHFDRQ